MRPRARAALLFFVAVTAHVSAAAAQVGRPTPPPSAPVAPPAAVLPGNVRAHVGTDYAARLLRSTDPGERIRGIQRAASLGTPEAIALLVQATEASPAIRSDARALIELARALSRFADQDRARAALLLIVNAGQPGVLGRLPSARPPGATPADVGDPVARAELARQIAAIALARAGGERGLEQLYGVARSSAIGQLAAIHALTLAPPRDPGFFGNAGAVLPIPVVRMLGQLGDLRALEVIHSAVRASDANMRSAALVSLAELGDERTIALARTAIAESDARLRAAAGEALVLLAAPERFKAVAALIADEGTTAIGVRLAERVHDAEITKLLAARAAIHPDREVRSSAIRALGRSPEPAAATALASPALLADPTYGYESALALARSPAPNALALITSLASGAHANLGVRAYVVRALVRGERSSSADDVLARLAASSDGRARALGVFGRVALEIEAPESPLADRDSRVRRAAVMGTLAHPSKKTHALLLSRIAKEPDPVVRQLLALGLVDGDPSGIVTTTSLVDRAASGGADAALSAYALMQRADESLARKVDQLLSAKDPVLRAHAARGLAASSLADASGRLADAYAYETDATVRRAIVSALAARQQDAAAPARKSTLETAAELDPDGPTRQAARRALLGTRVPSAPSFAAEAAWLRVTLDDGRAPSSTPFVGSLVRADGVAIPLAFDDDGFAVVGGLPAGEARLVLAPRLPSYEADGRP